MYREGPMPPIGMVLFVHEMGASVDGPRSEAPFSSLGATLPSHCFVAISYKNTYTPKQMC